MSEDEEGRAAPEVTSGVPRKRQIRRRVPRLGLLGAGLVWWLWAAPPAELEIAGPVVFAEMDAALVRVQPLEDDFGRSLQRVWRRTAGI